MALVARPVEETLEPRRRETVKVCVGEQVSSLIVPSWLKESSCSWCP